MQLVLGTHEHVAHHHPVPPGGDTLLARIQADVRADRRPQPRELDPADRSIQIHSCHGRARQVEVLRDAILHLLEEDDTLQPRDVIVMCPDIEAFAPLIQATFGAGEVIDDEFDPLPEELRPTDLRVRLADRSLRQTNPVLGVVAQLIDLAGRRLTASDVLDLADREPVRRRFRLEDEDLARIRDWVADSGIRWGLDAEHRAPYKLADLDAGTWKAGLDRVLVGVTMTEEGHRLFEGVLPVDDVESLAIDLAGRMAELVDRLQAAVDAFGTAKPVGEWAQALATAADALTATSQRDAWQRAQLERILGDVVAEAGANDVQLTLLEVRALLAERLQGRPTRANFRTGHLTICTLVPMRSVPHRVVCLLGLDDEAFPRKAPRDGDDIMLADPHVGDRDPRPEDRQMLLDALMAASDRLIVTYAGNDVRTNTPRPPAVPVGELLDTIERTAPGAQVVVRHPLQPFDPRNFTPGVLGGDEAWSFNRVTLDGARAMEAPRVHAAAVPGEPAAAAERAGAGTRRPRRLRPPPGAGVPAPAARLRRRELRRRGRRRAPDRARQPRVLAGRPADARRPPRGCKRRRGGRGGARPRRPAARRARRPGDREAAARRSSRSSSTPAAAAPRRIGGRAGHAPGRPQAQRHRPGRPRHAAAQRHLLARQPTPPARDLGAVPAL